MRRSRVLPLLLLSTLVGCDVVLGIEPMRRGDPTAVAFARAECERCSKESCLAATRACAADRDCQPLYECIAACEPNAVRCRQECESRYPIAARAPLYGGVDRCLRGACTESCLGVGAIGAHYSDACTCLDDACKPQTLACIRSALDRQDERAGNCERRFACVLGKTIDPESAVECSALFPGGDREARALKECWADQQCAGCAVAGAGLYECKGRYRWRAPTQPKVKLKFTVTAFDASQKPVPGAEVRACGADKCGRCDASDAVSTSTSDANGVAVLELPTGPTGFGGCFDFTAPGYARMSMSLGRPVTRDGESPMFLVASDTLPLLGVFAGTSLRADRGHVVVFASDCFISFAPGVSFDLTPSDGDTKRGYFVNNTFDTKATETGRLGTGVFINVPPGIANVTTKRGGELIGNQPVIVREGVVTAVITFPLTAD